VVPPRLRFEKNAVSVKLLRRCGRGSNGLHANLGVGQTHFQLVCSVESLAISLRIWF
jgi:hypothetical protein